ncbi:Uncharacterized protein TCM_000923 [Theobroma cacao]|uniref:Uncharacterized protein n=1 Tax=Theobroma cacao TaxID=3641 RepID=A0A061DI10_THECC|nr:Uncharacterized protein TCM_000923 [Theobroma cacao]
MTPSKLSSVVNLMSVRKTSLPPYTASFLTISGESIFLPFPAVQGVIYACIVSKALMHHRPFYHLLLVLYLSFILTNDRVSVVVRSANYREPNDVGISAYAAYAIAILAFTARIFLVPWLLL